MKSVELQRRITAPAILALCLPAALIEKFSGRFTIQGSNFVFQDPFHQGEYFAVAQSLSDTAGSPFPALSIHGALDYIPYFLVSTLSDTNHSFLPTFFLYCLLGLIACLLVSILGIRLSDQPRPGLPALCLALSAAFTVGYRDLFLLLCLLLFYLLIKPGYNRQIRGAQQVAFGLCMALGLVWSFDRGIAACLSLGTATLVLLLRQRDYLIALAVFVLTLALAGLIHPILAPSSLLENILVLMRTSAQWRLAAGPQTTPLIEFAVQLNMLAVLGSWFSHWRAHSLKKALPELIALSLLAALFTKIGTNRADPEHIHYALWIPMLLAIRTPCIQSRVQWLSGAAAVWLLWQSFLIGLEHTTFVPALAAACLLQANTPRYTWQRCIANLSLYASLLFSIYVFALNQDVAPELTQSRYGWVTPLAKKQLDQDTVAPDIQWASDELQRHKADCVFDLANHGLINGLARLPACSRFTYPVYASADYENELINDVKLSNVPVLIYSSTFWSYNIDGRSMKQRFPALDAFIIQHYPIEICRATLCLRYQEGLRDHE